MKKLSLILFSVLILFFETQSYSKEKFIFGKAQVIDGDTIKINGKSIRLYGIDAPEMKQLCKDKYKVNYACGYVSKFFLKSFIKDAMKIKNYKNVFCYYNELDRYNRIIGECFVGPKKIYSLNSAMILSGNAVAYLRYSDKYLNDQNKAKLEKKGIWSGVFIFPEEWRRKNK